MLFLDAMHSFICAADFTDSMDRGPPVYRYQPYQRYVVLSENERALRKGDRVKLHLCSLTPEGIIVDEYSDDYVSVQWDDLPTPATYSRRSLVLIERV